MVQVGFTVSGIVPAIRQPAPNSCRRTAAAHARISKGISGGGESDSAENVTIFTQKFDDVGRQDVGDGEDFRLHAVHC